MLKEAPAVSFHVDGTKLDQKHAVCSFTDLEIAE